MKTVYKKCQVCACLFPKYHEADCEAIRRGGIGFSGWVCFKLHFEEGEPGGVFTGMAGRWKVRKRSASLVERPTTVLCSTQARDLVLLQWELVVVGDLFIDCNGLL